MPVFVLQVLYESIKVHSVCIQIVLHCGTNQGCIVLIEEIQ